jgi:hypothetical protein
MVRRIAVVAILVGAGLAVAPTSASADPLCEGVAYYGVTTVAVGPQCLPYPLGVDCSSGFIGLGPLGLAWDDICLPGA